MASKMPNLSSVSGGITINWYSEILAAEVYQQALVILFEILWVEKQSNAKNPLKN